jgi:hypothetical protein
MVLDGQQWGRVGVIQTVARPSYTGEKGIEAVSLRQGLGYTTATNNTEYLGEARLQQNIDFNENKRQLGDLNH